MKSTSTVIIGGGISGLSFAHYCAEAGMDPILLEKDELAGGCINTAIHGNHRLELGAHAMFNSYRNIIEILETRGLLNHLEPREKHSYKVLDQDQLFSVPQKIGWIQLLLSLPKLFGTKKEGRTVEEYYSKVLGKKNYQQLFRHFFNAVLSQDAGQFPALSVFRKRARRKDVLKSFSFPKGLGQVAQELCKHPNLQFLPNCAPESIVRENGVFVVKTPQGDISANRLVMAVPPPVAAKLLLPIYPEAAGILASIQTNDIQTLGVFCKKEDVKAPLLGGLVGIDYPFYSAVSMDVATGNDKNIRAFAFHFKCPCPSLEEQKAVVGKALGCDPAHFLKVFERTSCLPGFRADHLQIAQQLTDVIKNEPLYLTGNYFKGMALEDCVERSFEEFQRLRHALGK